MNAALAKVMSQGKRRLFLGPALAALAAAGVAEAQATIEELVRTGPGEDRLLLYAKLAAQFLWTLTALVGTAWVALANVFKKREAFARNDLAEKLAELQKRVEGSREGGCAAGALAAQLEAVEKRQDRQEARMDALVRETVEAVSASEARLLQAVADSQRAAEEVFRNGLTEMLDFVSQRDQREREGQRGELRRAVEEGVGPFAERLTRFEGRLVKVEDRAPAEGVA